MNWHSLRARILFTYTGLIFVGFVGLAFIAGGQISTATTEDYERRLAEQVELVARGLKDPIEHAYEGEVSESTLLNLLTEYGRNANLDISLLYPDGRVWLQTAVIPLSPNLPEISAARNRQITYDTREDDAGQVTIYAAAPVTEDGSLMAIIHFTAPFTAARALIAQRWLSLAGVVLLLTVATLLVSLGLSTSLTRPLAELHSSAVRIADGQFSHRLPTARQDELGQLAAAFNHMAAQVEAMIEEQRTFASNASHELRTPLTAIRLRSEALRENLADEATARQYIIDIDDEARRLSDLVQDLILLSRFDSGRLQVGQEQIDLARLARQLYQENNPQAAANGQTLTLNVPATLPPVAASLTHLRVVFHNLLTNALKYTPPNGRINWQITQEGNWLVSVIEDDGQGIPPADLPHVFDRFYRVDKARVRQTSGVGLGLSLVQSIVLFYNGEIRIDSAGVGQGTAVTVRWPISDTPILD
ncbi:MAG: HAMP domain-containing sensor histidine kinase [Chloroflexota bacterium]